MHNIDNIGIRVENAPPDASAHIASPLSVLHEIKYALERLNLTGDSTTIDLHSLPFGPGDRKQLYQALDNGEVEATVHSLGETKIRETAYPGVWLVEYLSPNGTELTTHIEITRTPSLLATPGEEINDSLKRLDSLLATDPFSLSEESEE